MLLRLTKDLSVDPARVQSLAWDRTSADSLTLVVHMADGTEHHIRHDNWTNAYEIERKLLGQAK